MDSRPSFETRVKNALLRMRSVQVEQRYFGKISPITFISSASRNGLRR
ncbi:MAG: hypothetical protein JWQ17_6757 [Tardiphaga sp.]|jgi:hypothetical protein|nr:hypothetical protein [Tardiphaga sp.]